MPKAVHFTKGSIIYFEGDKDDRIFILQEGLVILTSMDLASRTPVTENIHKGEFFGVKSALGHFPREETATVLSQATAMFRAARSLIKTLPSTAMDMSKATRQSAAISWFKATLPFRAA